MRCSEPGPRALVAIHASGGPPSLSSLALIAHRMKTPRSFAFITAALIIGFLAIRWGAAQPARQLPPDEPKTDYAFGLRELESFVSYLQDTKQTNALRRFNDYSNATIVSEHS